MLATVADAEERARIWSQIAGKPSKRDRSAQEAAGIQRGGHAPNGDPGRALCYPLEVAVDPLAVVEAFGNAWAEHDLDGVIDLITDDCVFDTTEPAPDGTRYVGKTAIRQAWRPIFDDHSSRFDAEETFAAGDRVVQRWRYRWDGGHVRGVDLFKVREGRVAEKLSYVKG